MVFLNTVAKAQRTMEHKATAIGVLTGRAEVDREALAELRIVRPVVAQVRIRNAEAEAKEVWSRAKAEAEEVWSRAEAEPVWFRDVVAEEEAEEVWIRKVEEVWFRGAVAEEEQEEVCRRARAKAERVWIRVAERVWSIEAQGVLLRARVEARAKAEADVVLRRARAEAEEARRGVVALVSLVYLYLLGYIDRGCTKTYSRGSLEVRSTYVSIVLLQGAYVWIKFRDVASSKRGGYRRPVTDKVLGIVKPSDKIEARYTPPRESGNHSHIYLGLCATHEEAEVKKKIAAFYYGRNTGRLDFDDGQFFLIPSMPTEQEQGLSVALKRAWVKQKVTEVYEDIKGLRANVHASIVPLDEQINACHHSSLPVGQFEPASEHPSVIFDPEFSVEEYPTRPEDINADFWKSLEESLDFSKVMSDVPNAKPQQHLQDNHVQGFGIDMTFDSQGHYSSLDTEPLGTSCSIWGSESIRNFVHEALKLLQTPMTWME